VARNRQLDACCRYGTGVSSSEIGVTHRVLSLPRNTRRLILRPPSTGDAETIQRAIEETYEDLHRWMPWASSLQTLEETCGFLKEAERRYLEGEDFAVSAFLKETGEFVLSTGLHPRNWSVPKFEIGYWCRARMQRRGYTTEAVRALTEAAFQELKAMRVEIRCDSRNTHSRRVAERAGYHLEAKLRSDDRANDGSLRDTVIYVLLAEDFEFGE
jgi:RimJ/RimL family protein N-acetyltransferase